jgi:PAS domain S-box-containing protein
VVSQAVRREDFKDQMIDASSLPMPGSPVAAAAAPLADPRTTAPRGRAILLLSILMGSVAIGAWIFIQATEIMHAAQVGSGEEVLRQLTHWRLVAAASVLGGGLFLGLLVMIISRVVDKSWARHLEAIQSEAAIQTDRLRSQSDRLRMQMTGSEERLIKTRENLEAKVALLTGANEEMKSELDRRRRTERTLAMQSQYLEASKDVLQIHVQARSQELQKLQRQYELILNAAGEGICGVDPEGRITFVNPTAARLMGLEVEKMVGLKEAELFAAMPLDPAAPSAEISSGKPVEVLLTRADNSTFTAEFMRSQILENDRVVGGVVLLKDVTERREAAEALEHKAEELARSNAELEQFAFVASHDLQEPLRKIRAFGDRLNMKCAAVLPADGADYLARMQNAAARMQTLIADLLTFSRVISRTEPFVEVDLGQVTREVLSDLEVRVEKVGATVTVGELPKIQADPMQMRQLLQNLIGNALKFQSPGVKPQVQIAAHQIQLSDEYSSGAEAMCELTVKDNGIGFDEKYLEKIFAVFQRLHNRQEYEGTGIGLAVCRRIVDRHGGSITARSKPGTGATFVVQLPVRSPAKDK